jgi:hypothetical protein
MPKYSVMVNRTVETSTEITVSAKNEDEAREKAGAKIQKVLDLSNKPIEDAFEWEQTGDNYEYEATQE